MTPEEALQLAREEIKRADHSIAVSLKYTRTVDVIKSIVQRLIGTISYSLHAYLEHARVNKIIEDEVPELPRLKIELARKSFSDDPMVLEFCDFFLLLRKIDKAEFKRSQEYRRHVTMTAKLDDGAEVELTIDIITDYFTKTEEFFECIEKTIIGDD